LIKAHKRFLVTFQTVRSRSSQRYRSGGRTLPAQMLHVFRRHSRRRSRSTFKETTIASCHIINIFLANLQLHTYIDVTETESTRDLRISAWGFFWSHSQVCLSLPNHHIMPEHGTGQLSWFMIYFTTRSVSQTAQRRMVR
jgi:hypothetical protein